MKPARAVWLTEGLFRCGIEGRPADRPSRVVAGYPWRQGERHPGSLIRGTLVKLRRLDALRHRRSVSK